MCHNKYRVARIGGARFTALLPTTPQGAKQNTNERVPTMTTKKKLRFECECKGCRNYAPDLAGISYPTQIADRVQGHYLDRATMKFFHSRILTWRHDPVSGALQVATSNAGDMDNNYRAYEVVTYCKWGHLIIERDTMTGGTICRRFTTTRKARADMTQERAQLAASVCDCHGCQLDKAGR
jgi:hypothetical protein